MSALLSSFNCLATSKAGFEPSLLEPALNDEAEDVEPEDGEAEEDEPAADPPFADAASAVSSDTAAEAAEVAGPTFAPLAGGTSTAGEYAVCDEADETFTGTPSRLFGGTRLAA